MRISLHARSLWAVASFGLLLRLAVPVVQGGDELHARGYHFYVEMADNLRAGEGLHRALPFGHGDRFAIRTPLYPLVLAPLRGLPGFPWLVAIFGALCGTGTILIVGSTARRLFGERAGLAAAVAVALWPHLVLHDTALQDTALYTLLLASALALCLRLVEGEVERPRAAALAFGLACALGVLTRVALLPSVLVLMAWPALVAARSERRRQAGWAAVSLVLFALTLSPWLVRNHRLLGAPVLTSDTGRSLWLGNNPETFSVYPEQSIDRAEERAWLAMPESERAEARALGDDELASDAWFRARATAWIAEHPGEAFVGGLRKAWAAFSPWFSPVGSLPKQLVHVVTWTPAALLALASAWRHRRRWRALAPIGFCLALFALQCAVFFGHSAYRLYLDPWVIVVASGLLAAKRGSEA